MEITIKPLGPELRADFHALLGKSDDCTWCRCVAWWVPSWEGFSERTAEQNRALRDELFDRGEYDGYLLYEGGQPVAWCQVGPRDRLSKLVDQFKLEPDPEVWAVTCFAVAPEARRRGLARRLLATILKELAGTGIRRIQAFPRRGEGLEPGELWTGPESLYREAGFTILRDHRTMPILEWRAGR